MTPALLLAAALFLTLSPLGANDGGAGPPAPPAVVEVHTAAPTVLVVVLQTGPHLEPGPVDPLDLTPARWTVDGEAPAALHHTSIPWDEQKAIPGSPDRFPVTVRHRIYLRLARPLQPGHTYRLATPYGTRELAFDARATFCESIKVNQVGYSRRATSRFANFGVYMGDGGSLTITPPPDYEVIEERSGRVVAAGRAAPAQDDTRVAAGAITSGEQVYRLRLDAVPPGGPYFVSLPGCGRSRSFGVGDDYSRRIAYVATRGLYHQRCGIALERPFTAFTRGACHLQVADTRAPWTDGHLLVPAGAPLRPIAGGYHDAGDFDRRPFHTLVPLLMLAYFEAFPAHFVDRQYDLPESGNGVPDFLDEALWGLRIWEELQVTDPANPQEGGVQAGTEMDRHPTYGVHSAANDPGRYGTWGVLDDHTALCAGLFAHAARLLRPYDRARADRLLGRAQRAWAYLKQSTDLSAPRTGTMYAALQLYLATGEAEYHDRFKRAASAIIVTDGTWPEQYLPGNTAAKAQTAHFVSYLLPHGRATDAALARALKERILHFADTGTYMGPPPEKEPYPQGVTRFMGWGAATAQGRYADVYAFAARFTTDPARKQACVNAVSQYADYSLGLNPLGLSYYTGLGTDQPVSPLHLDSYFTRYGLSDGVSAEHAGRPIGNVPGILVYGPTEGRSGAPYQTAVSDKLYPAFERLPAQRRYAHGWSLVNGNEFTVWETMVWNVVMLGFLDDRAAGAGKAD